MLNSNPKNQYPSFMKVAWFSVTLVIALAVYWSFLTSSRSHIQLETERSEPFLEPGNLTERLSSTLRKTGGNGSIWRWEFDTKPVKLGKPSSSNSSQKTIPLIVFRSNIFPYVVSVSARSLPWSFDTSYLKCALPYLQPGLDCKFTFHTQKLGQADAVLTQMFQWNMDLNHPVYQRPRNQIWVFFIWVSPSSKYGDSLKLLAKYDSFFNWTMTYRLDSNVSFSYGHFVPLKVPDWSRKKDRFSRKSRMAVVMTSHCHTKSRREDYLEQLIKAGISIDQLGKCQGKKLKRIKTPEVCVRTNLYSTTAACERMLGSKYKFYLAFENAICRDYVTEKFFRAASLDAIPVVLNGANMSQFAPNGSYIDSKDFASPKELATYLKKVASDKDLYNSFFWWKPYYDVEITFEGFTFHKNLCHLCQQLHDYKRSPQESYFYPNISEWFDDQAHCEVGKNEWS